MNADELAQHARDALTELYADAVARGLRTLGVPYRDDSRLAMLVAYCYRFMLDHAERTTKGALLAPPIIDALRAVYPPGVSDRTIQGVKKRIGELLHDHALIERPSGPRSPRVYVIPPHEHDTTSVEISDALPVATNGSSRDGGLLPAVAALGERLPRLGERLAVTGLEVAEGDEQVEVQVRREDGTVWRLTVA